MSNKGVRSLFVLLAFVILSACGGGGSSTGTDDISTGGDLVGGDTTDGDTTDGDTTDGDNVLPPRYQGSTVWPYNLASVYQSVGNPIFEFIYDDSGRLEISKHDGVIIEQHSHDENGNLIEILHKDGQKLRFIYENDTVKRIEEYYNSTEFDTLNCFYGDNGFLNYTRQEAINGYYIDEIETTEDGRIISIIESESFNGELYIDNQIDFYYDDSSNLIQISQGDATWTYNYDDSNKMSKAFFVTTDLSEDNASIDVFFNQFDVLEKAVVNYDSDKDGSADYYKTFYFQFNNYGMPLASYGFPHPYWGKYKVNIIAEILARVYWGYVDE